MQGPRVRMGLHWAPEGTVATRLHALTKHRVFVGPGLQVAQEVRGRRRAGARAAALRRWGVAQRQAHTASHSSLARLA